jgi:excisionase family DNA binding protein
MEKLRGEAPERRSTLRLEQTEPADDTCYGCPNLPRNPMFSTKLLLSVREVAALTSLSLRTTSKLIASGEIKSIRVGRRRLIPRVELDRFTKTDHSIRVTSTVALRRRTKPLRKHRKPSKKRRALSKKSRSIKRRKSTLREPICRARLKKPTTRKVNRLIDPRVARAVSYMRRTGASASEAAHREGIKLKSLVRGAGRSLYRRGPGKPWVVRSNDQLEVSMTILTRRGPIEAIVRDSRERRKLHQYNVALRMFRAGEDGAEATLKKLEGQRVAGHTLITDVNLLIQLEEAGQLDFDSFYTALGGRS